MSTQKNDDKEIKLNTKFNLSETFPVPTYEDWKISAEKLLKGQSFEKKLLTKTYEGIDLDPIYTRKDIADLSFINSKPGTDNYLRGNNSDGYLNKSWEICQEIKADLPREFNTLLKEALKRGQTALLINLDSLKDLNEKTFSELLSGIDLIKHPVYIRTNFSSSKALNLYLEYAEKSNFDLDKIRGNIEWDPIAYLAEFGVLPGSPDNIHDEMENTIKTASEDLPNFKTIGVNGTLFHNAGADSVTELAIALGIAVEYLTEMTSRGIDINKVAQGISFRIGIGTNFFMEISKLRALRVLWQNVIKEFGGNEESQKTHIHAEASKYFQTQLDPFVNTLRTTTEAFSAILGGADVITTNPYDDVLGEKSDLSMRIARNTQIILKEESNLKRLIDPAGGSYYIESLTEKIIKNVWSEFQNIEKNGGALNSLKSNYIQDKIEEVVNKRRNDVFKRRSIIVGTNMFVNSEDTIPDPKKEIDKNIDTENNGLRVNKLNLSRIAEPFEDMRKIVADYSEKVGQKPKIFLANFGEVKQYKGRADFSRGYFEVGGFEIIYPDGFLDIQKMAEEAAKSDAHIVVICSDDPTYPKIIEDFILSLKNKKVDVSKPEKTVILAGFPGKNEEQYRKWGIDDFIFMGSNVFSILESLLNKTGVK